MTVTLNEHETEAVVRFTKADLAQSTRNVTLMLEAAIAQLISPNAGKHGTPEVGASDHLTLTIKASVAPAVHPGIR